MLSLSRFFHKFSLNGPNQLSTQIINLICNAFNQDYHHGDNINTMRIKDFHLVRNMFAGVITKNINYDVYSKLDEKSQHEIKQLIANRLVTVIKSYRINHGHNIRNDGYISTDTFMYDIVYEWSQTKWNHPASWGGNNHGQTIHKKYMVIFPEKLFLDRTELQRELQSTFDRISPLMTNTNKRKFLSSLPNDNDMAQESEASPLLKPGSF